MGQAVDWLATPPKHRGTHARLTFVCLFLHNKHPFLDLECVLRLAGTAGIGRESAGAMAIGEGEAEKLRDVSGVVCVFALYAIRYTNCGSAMFMYKNPLGNLEQPNSYIRTQLAFYSTVLHGLLGPR